MTSRLPILPAVAALTAILSTPPALAAWNHAAAPGGQFEGGASGNGIEVSYSCTGFSSGVTFRLPGDHAGPARIEIDGAELAQIRFAYTAAYSASIAEIDAKTGPGALNRMIDAIAAGNTLTVVTADQNKASLSLAGSARIQSCRIR